MLSGQLSPHLQVVVEPEGGERDGGEPEEERPRGHLGDAQRVEDEGEDDRERMRGEHGHQAPVDHVPGQFLRPVELGALGALQPKLRQLKKNSKKPL